MSPSLQNSGHLVLIHNDLKSGIDVIERVKIGE